MVKIYYNVELSSKTIYGCVYELSGYELGMDYKTIYYKDQIAFTNNSILPDLLNRKHHYSVDGERIIDGSKVESVFHVCFSK